MKYVLSLSLCLLSVPCCAGDLESFGIDEMTPMTNQEAEQVRGQGIQTSVNSIGTQSFAFALSDHLSGSVFNLNSTAQQNSLDSSNLYSNASGGSQAVGIISQGGVQLGDAMFEMGEFSFSLAGFQTLAQASLVAGPSAGLDFSSMLAR
jgi:hypothetical protein